MPAIVENKPHVAMVARSTDQQGPAATLQAATYQSNRLGSYRILALDGRGTLEEMALLDAQMAEGQEEQDEQDDTVKNAIQSLHEAKGSAANKGDLAVQRTAAGRLRNHDVLAVARKDGRIDIFDRQTGQLVITLRNNEMKKGVHRWVGLAVAHDGVFACTSAGDLRFFSIEQEESSMQGSQGQDGQGALTVSAEPLRRELPEPLQTVTFAPSSEPTHFAYGGEEIALSVWDARLAFTEQPAHSDGSESNMQIGSEDGHRTGHTNGATMDEGDTSLNNKAKKRKRLLESRARARELHWGEVWRAKNLPNDALSLPQRPDIVSIGFLRSINRLAIGTRSGLIRLYDTAAQRKHLREFRVFGSAQDKVPIRQLAVSHSGMELIAADTTGKVFVCDVHSGVTLYQYKGIHGAIVAMQSLPPMTGVNNVSYLVTASADRLVRLHTIPIERGGHAEGDRRSTKQKGQTVASHFVREGVTGISWDGVVPRVSDDARQTHLAKRRELGEVADEEEEVEDGLWDAMATVEDDQGEAQASKSKRRR